MTRSGLPLHLLEANAFLQWLIQLRAIVLDGEFLGPGSMYQTLPLEPREHRQRSQFVPPLLFIRASQRVVSNVDIGAPPPERCRAPTTSMPQRVRHGEVIEISDDEDTPTRYWPLVRGGEASRA